MKARIDYKQTAHARHFLLVTLRGTMKSELLVGIHTFQLPAEALIIEFRNTEDNYEFDFTIRLINNLLPLGTFTTSLSKKTKKGEPKRFSFEDSIHYGLRHVLNTNKVKFHENNLKRVVNELVISYNSNQAQLSTVEV